MWDKAGSGSCKDITTGGFTYNPENVAVCGDDCDNSQGSLSSNYSPFSSSCRPTLTKGGVAGIVIGSLVFLYALYRACSGCLRGGEKQQYAPRAEPDMRVRVAPSPAPAPAPAPTSAASPWEQHADPSSGRPYWVNRATGESSWAPPPQAPPPPPAPPPRSAWEQHIDPGSGRPYWCNRATGETSWTPQ